MKALVFGSLNIDYVYSVPHFVQPGETIASTDRQVFCGGKGLNQAIALARYGLDTWMAGAVGQKDGDLLLSALVKAGVDISFVNKKSCSSGHTIIQNTPEGENNIILFGGANQNVDFDEIDDVLSHFDAGDYLILQNEINNIPYIMEKAHEKGMLIVFNPSPLNDLIFDMPLEYVDFILLNEIEAAAILGLPADDTLEAPPLLDQLVAKFPDTQIVLTLGSQGSLYGYKNERQSQGIYPVKAVDTTAAGDTYTGYFIGEIANKKTPAEAMATAAAASALAVSRKGASPSIPTYKEYLDFIQFQQ